MSEITQDSAAAPEQAAPVTPARTLEDKLYNVFPEAAPEGHFEPPPEAAPEPQVAETPEPTPEPEPEPAAEPEVEEHEITTFAELGEYLQELGVEVTAEQLYGLTMPVRGEDGEAAPVAIGQLKDRAQSSADVARARAEVKAEREAIATERKAQAQQHNEALAQASATVQAVNQWLAAVEQNLAQVRESNPAEYAARAQELRTMREALGRAQQQAVVSYRVRQQQDQQRTAAEQAQATERTRAALLQAFPEWSDEARWREDGAKIAAQLGREGYSAEEVDAMTDHRVMIMADKARRYDELQQAANPKGKRVLTLAKARAPKPGKPQAEQGENAQLQAARRAFKKSGRLEDAAPILDAKLRRLGMI